MDVNDEGRFVDDAWMCGGCVDLMDGRKDYITRLELENADLKKALLIALTPKPLPDRRQS